MGSLRAHPIALVQHGWTSWLFWQHSQSGSVAGVTGAVDLDLFGGTLQQLQELAQGGSGVL